MLNWIWQAVVVGLLAAWMGQPSQPGKAQAPAPAAEPAKPAARTFADADALLDALETADRDLRTFSADVQYTKRFADIQGGDAQIRRGRLSFRSAEPGPNPAVPPRRAFAVVFDQLVVDSTMRSETVKFIFDGEWLVERNDTTKQFMKRRIVPAGKVVDPLKIGEGPLVLPLGQKKSEILKRFDAELLDRRAGLTADDARLHGLLEGTVQLKLTPKPGLTEARDFDEIRLWYRTEDLLPRMARTTTPNGAASEVLLINQRRNQGGVGGAAEAEMFDTSSPPADAGWDIDVREDVRVPG